MNDTGRHIVSPGDVRRIMLVIVLVATVARLLYLREAIESPYFAAPFLDELYHFQWARSIAGGELLHERVFFRAPLYSYMLGTKFFLVGQDFVTTKFIQYIVGIVTTVLVFMATFFLFGGKVREEIELPKHLTLKKWFSTYPAIWIALVSGVLYAIYPPAIFFEGEMLDIAFSCFFFALLPAVVLAFRRHAASPNRWVGVIGLIIGICAITRPNVLIFVPFIFVYLLVSFPGTKSVRTLLKSVLLFVVGIVIPLIPVTLHNAVVGECFVPISSYDGINFYIGNNQIADGYTPKTPHRYVATGEYRDSVELFAEKEAALLLGYEPTAAEIRTYWYRRALREIRQSPEHFFQLMAKKFVLFWNAYEIKNNKSLYVVAEFVPLWGFLFKRILGYGILAPFALCGIILALAYSKKQRREIMLVLAMIVAFCFSVVLFFVSCRHRLPVVVLLCPFAGYTVYFLLESASRKKFSLTAITIILIVILVVLVNIDWYGVKEKYNPARDYWTVANCYRQKGEHEHALNYYNKALQFDASLVDAHNNLGETYFVLERYGEALKAFKQTIQLEPDYIKGYNNLGVVYEETGKTENAAAMYRTAIALESSYGLAHKNLGDLLANTGDVDAARYHYEWAQRLGIKKPTKTLENEPQTK